MRLVRPAMAASTISGADTAKSGRWCSPTPKASTPTSSASTPSSITLRMTCAWDRASPSGPAVMSPKVSSPNSKFCAMGLWFSLSPRRRRSGRGSRAQLAMNEQVRCGHHPCNAGRQKGLLFGQSGAQTGSILPAASCDSPNPTCGLISGRERGQIDTRDVISLNKQTPSAPTGAATRGMHAMIRIGVAAVTALAVRAVPALAASRQRPSKRPSRSVSSRPSAARPPRSATT